MNFVDTDTLRVTDKVDGGDVSVVISYEKFSPIDSMRLIEAFGEQEVDEDGNDLEEPTIKKRIKTEEDVQDVISAHITDVDGIELNGKTWSNLSQGERRRIMSLVPQLLFQPLLKAALNRPEEEEKNG